MGRGNRWNRCVSAVISVVILILLVVVLATVLFAGTQQLASNMDAPSPVVGTDFEFEHRDGSVVATKIGGDTVDTDSLEIIGPGEAVFEDDELTGGDRFTINIHEPGGEFRLVYTGEERTDAVLAQTDNPITGNLGGLPENITLGYEDLDKEESDFDYADWVVKTGTQIEGYEANGNKYAQEVTIDFTPRASYAGYTHDQYIVPDELGSGEYELTVYDEDGDVIESESASGESFDSDTEIHIMYSGDAYDPDVTESDGTPQRTAELTLDLDDATRIPSDPINETTQHGSALPYDPLMKPYDDGDHTGAEIGAGDLRLVTVQEDWQWPDDSVHIAEAYEHVTADDVNEDGNEPTFETRTWFEEPADEDVVNSP